MSPMAATQSARTPSTLSYSKPGRFEQCAEHTQHFPCGPRLAQRPDDSLETLYPAFRIDEAAAGFRERRHRQQDLRVLQRVPERRHRDNQFGGLHRGTRGVAGRRCRDPSRRAATGRPCAAAPASARRSCRESRRQSAPPLPGNRRRCWRLRRGIRFLRRRCARVPAPADATRSLADDAGPDCRGRSHGSGPLPGIPPSCEPLQDRRPPRQRQPGTATDLISAAAFTTWARVPTNADGRHDGLVGHAHQQIIVDRIDQIELGALLDRLAQALREQRLFLAQRVEPITRMRSSLAISATFMPSHGAPRSVSVGGKIRLAQAEIDVASAQSARQLAQQIKLLERGLRRRERTDCFGAMGSADPAQFAGNDIPAPCSSRRLPICRRA